MEYEERHVEVVSREYPSRLQTLRMILEKMHSTRAVRVSDGMRVDHFYMSPYTRLTLTHRATHDDVSTRTVWSLHEYEQEMEESMPTLVNTWITSSHLLPALARIENMLVEEQRAVFARTELKKIPETYGQW